MTAEEPTLRRWLRQEVLGVLARRVSPPPLLIWSDPGNAWRELLRAAAEGGAFDLWCDGAHGLVLRERLLAAPPAPRVVWLPVARDERAGLLAAGVLARKDVEKAIADRAKWRADERRWRREGKLPQPGWWSMGADSA